MKLYADTAISTAPQKNFEVPSNRIRKLLRGIAMALEYLVLARRYDEAVLEINRAIQLARDSTVLHHNAGQI